MSSSELPSNVNQTTTLALLPSILPSTLSIKDSVLSCIGGTPLVRLDRLASAHGIRCNLLGKLEYFNAGGSVKDRIASRMVIEAEAEGRLVPGKSVIIEPTSGNTGIGLALIAAVKGYRCIIVLPEKMSREKINTMKALGAEIVRTPTEAAFDSPESHLSVAARLEKAIPGGIILDQYKNRYNPQAHYDATAIEIIEAIANTPQTEGRRSSGKVDLLIAGAGTGGTLTGVSGRLKAHQGVSGVHTIGVDPVGSILARPESLNVGGVSSYRTEGTGYDFVPDALDYSLVDEWMKTTDNEAFGAVRELIKREGALCGGSSGQAVAAAIRYLSPGGRGWESYGRAEEKNVVLIFADSIRNYVTKDWLVEGTETAETTEAAILAGIVSTQPSSS
ncbi:hypothetical protein CROQUDRAFT_59361 [Cronartium quercuum f. sp. fusiforme G11]|uniref:cystathionine beta-synthase n=1 Tax=Cronartium quercuum f. sp. fusiforme G11 TaxID=708437 RepID=A0A9P6TF54_9BASI|nr:hypothetical protein CROQUDRAFT_59361 [Cronartium quercuum f. sp. fusiforme G11]